MLGIETEIIQPKDILLTPLNEEVALEGKERSVDLEKIPSEVL